MLNRAWRKEASTCALFCLIVSLLGSGAEVCSPPAGPPGITVDVATEAEIINALSNQSVTVIRVVSDIVLTAEMWATPVSIERSVLLTGESVPYSTIDFSYLSKKSIIQPNVTVTFCMIIVRQTRYQLQSLAPGYDFFDKVPTPPGENDTVTNDRTWAVVELYRAVSWFRACLPFDIAVAAAQRLSRPAAFPGVQNVSTQAVPQFCRRQTNQCWPNATGAQYDFAVVALTTNSVGNYLNAGYAFVTLESLYICDVLMTTECINMYGAGNCFTRTGSGVIVVDTGASNSPPAVRPSSPPALGPAASTPAPARVSTASSPAEVPIAAIAVPAALVGVCMLCAAGYIWYRWSARQADKGDVPAKVVDTDPEAPSTEGPSSGPDSAVPTAPPPDPSRETRKAAASAIKQTAERSGDAPETTKPTQSTEHQGSSVCSEARFNKSTESHIHSSQGASHDTRNMDLWDDNPLTAVVMEQDPHLPTVRLDINFAAEIRLIEGGDRGQGSFGRVVEADYQGQRVAVKMIHPAMVGTNQRSLKTFKQEVDILGKCKHRNVVQLIGACLTPPHVFLVEELMACSLDTVVHNRNKPLPLEQILLVARDIACGLAYLHPTIVHRDLKPANVLLDSNGTAKLTDFGLARLRDCTLVTKHPEAGTAPYVAPECFDTCNYTITDKADMYSFAVVLWEMLTRCHPWRGETPLAVAFKVTINQERLPLGLDESKCPRKLRKLIEECWDANPRRRPSAAVAAKQLTLVLQQIQGTTVCNHDAVLSAPHHAPASVFQYI